MTGPTDDDVFGPVMLLAGMGSGWLAHAFTGSLATGWAVGLTVLFSPFLLIAAWSAAEAVSDRWHRRPAKARVGPCGCGCGRVLPRGWDGLHGWNGQAAADGLHERLLDLPADKVVALAHGGDPHALLLIRDALAAHRARSRS